MKLIGISILFGLIFLSIQALAQPMLEFETDFRALAEEKFGEVGVKKLVGKYPLLGFNSNVPKSPGDSKYLLRDFSKTKLYRSQINSLLYDTNEFKIHLGCAIVMLAHDTTKIHDLEQIIKIRNYELPIVAATLLSLNTKNPYPVIKSIEKVGGDIWGQVLLREFLNQDSVILSKFIRGNLHNDDRTTRYLAIRSLGIGHMNLEKQNLLRGIVMRRDSLQGWALSILATAGASNTTELVSPNLKSEHDDLRQISYLVMANSSSQLDAVMLDSIIDAGEPIDVQLLIALNRSSNVSSLKKLLEIIQHRELPDGYFLSTEDNPLMKSGQLYDLICTTAKASKSPNQTLALFYLMREKKDEKTTDFLLDCLITPDLDPASVHATLSIIRHRSNEKIKKLLPHLVTFPVEYAFLIIDLLFEYEDYNYRDVVIGWTKYPLDEITKEKCEKYISLSN